LDIELYEGRDLRTKNVRIEWLEEEVDGAAGVPASDLRSRGLVGGENDDRNGSRALVLPQERCGLEPVELGHLEVEQDEGELLTPCDLYGLGARARIEQTFAERLEDSLERGEVRRMVVDEKDGRRTRRDR
jgi:hypothetical protein